MRIATIIGVGIAISVLVYLSRAVPQSDNLTDFDLEAAEQHFMSEYPGLFLKSLHDYDRFSDGARGFGVGNPIAQRVKVIVALPFATESELEVFSDYCALDAIVLAKNLDSTPILSGTKGPIITVSHFLVVDSIKSDGGFINSGRVVVYRLGGEIEDGGEILRIETPDMAPFDIGKTYVLHLTRDKAAWMPQYSLAIATTILIADSRVAEIPGWGGHWDEFSLGARYTDIATTFARIAKLKECP
jgi:hypothetical protein